jgi:mannose-6-phosphate isomerase-like protein (cupin superfamily)
MANYPVIDRENAEHYIWGEGCDGWHLLKQPGLSVIYERVPPGVSEVRHYHERATQFFFVLSGIAVLEIDGVSQRLLPQQGVAVDAQHPHQLRNESSEDVLFLVISAPATHALLGQQKDRIDT